MQEPRYRPLESKYGLPPKKTRRCPFCAIEVGGGKFAHYRCMKRFQNSQKRLVP